jgi:Arc/MetJ family transcription regulator
MQTSIDIDDRLMADALEATGAETQREAIELGLKTLVRLKRQGDLLKLQGKLEWIGDLDAMRRD